MNVSYQSPLKCYLVRDNIYPLLHYPLPPSSPSYSSLPLYLSVLSILLLTSFLPPSSQSSSSLPLSFLPLNLPSRYFSPCFLFLIPLHPPHYLPPSSQSSSSLPLSLLPLNLPHHLSILHSSQSATSLPLFSFL